MALSVRLRSSRSCWLPRMPQVRQQGSSFAELKKQGKPDLAHHIVTVENDQEKQNLLFVQGEFLKMWHLNFHCRQHMIKRLMSSSLDTACLKCLIATLPSDHLIEPLQASQAAVIAPAAKASINANQQSSSLSSGCQSGISLHRNSGYSS